MKSISRAKRTYLHRAVAAWYRKHRRTLQWRTTTDSYEILISEIMLQQTQVSRVQEMLPQFLRKFPSLRILARSSKADVVRAWQGMGYNNRAVRLHQLARIVMKRHNGQLPRDVEQLQLLPGIGPYTAHAVACFAFRQRTSVVDVNIRRVLSRLFWKMNSPLETTPEKIIWQLADRILPRNVYIWNQALMDLGATICTARKPMCSLCSVRQHCKSKKLGSIIHSRLKNKGIVKIEPLYHGLPRRIWRGKIIQTLRDTSDRKSLSLTSLGKAINLTKGDQRWLSDVIRQLEKEGLVSTKNISSSTYISLAA